MCLSDWWLLEVMYELRAGRPANASPKVSYSIESSKKASLR